MRDAKEKKTITKTVKMTESQCKQIEEKVAAHHMSFSSYLVMAGAHDGGCNLPEIVVMVQNIVNEVNAVICDANLPEDRKNQLNQEANRLWSKLK